MSAREAIEIPRLEGDARAAVEYRDGHLQIIASAGSGKTEVVSQRVASLLADSFEPEGIVAFTFTERAARELKSRIERRVEQHPQLGRTSLDKLGPMFVGTIHSYCFDLLREHVAKYETYDVLDDNRLIAFLTRHAYRIELTRKGEPLFAPIKRFVESLDVIENELMEPAVLEDPFRSIYERFLAALDEHRFLTYGQMIARTVRELSRPAVFEQVHAPLRQLIVDEYQDVNPAQEALVKRLAADPVHLCVVGDDDQAIYQWRGSNVEGIVRFRDRYSNVEKFTIEVNRRSRPAIIKLANTLAPKIENRLEKEMGTHRDGSGHPEVVIWQQETPEDEARVIAAAVKRAHDELGYRYRDIAILCRGRVSLPPIVDALRDQAVPVQPGGRTNLFVQPEADLFGRTVVWLVDRDWRPGQYGQAESVTLKELVRRYTTLYELDGTSAAAVRTRLEAWKAAVDDEADSANPIRELYELLDALAVADWDLDQANLVNRMGTLARCSQVVSDYESTRRRARPHHAEPGAIVGGTDRGKWFYIGLATYVQNWAQGSYEGFEGEEDVTLDAVDLTTIHKAKGLEWPIVFVPALTERRFPTSKTGTARDWWIGRVLFEPERYEGCVNDERRLFYVAMTRARDFLSLSTFEKMKQRQRPSPFLAEVTNGEIPLLRMLPTPVPSEPVEEDDDVLEITFSEMAAFLDCGKAYRLRSLVGFQPPLVSDLGYGKAVHHVLRQVAEFARARQRLPNERDLDRLFDDGFYLPASTRRGHEILKGHARRLVKGYLEDHGTQLLSIWAVERPFELHLGDAVVTGRADVIVDQSNGHERLAIVDYKTRDTGDDDGFQLQVYTDAGRREGLTIDGAVVHDLKAGKPISVPVDEAAIDGARVLATDLVDHLRRRIFTANAEKTRCGRCDVRLMCKERARG